MQARQDGSVLLTPAEAKAVAQVLKLSRTLAEQMGAGEVGHRTLTVEQQLLGALNHLEDLSVSPEELTEKVDSRRQLG